MPKQAQISGRVLNREELSGFLAISPTTLDRYVRAGCPILERGATFQGHKFNSGAVVKWLVQREATGADAAKSPSDERRRYTAAQADLKEFALSRARGEMIRVQDVAPIIADGLANCRSRPL